MRGSFGGTLANLASGYVVAHFPYQQPVFVCAALMYVVVWRIIHDR